MIRLEKLEKRYGNFRAVRGIDLDVPRGELFGLLGPNGAGKTTTIHMLGGIIKPTGGRLLVGGVDVQENPREAKRLLGYIPDRPHIYDKLTGWEFLYFVGGLYALSRAEIQKEGERWLERFELTEWGHQLTENYSHGMKQRLVLASALVHKPQVLLVDEPMVGLDPRGARLVKGILRELCDEGRTVFMSTHSLDVAEAVCDRLAIIFQGQIVALGSMDDLRTRAGSGAGDLEAVFMKITEEESAAGVPADRRPEPAPGAGP